jgi:hypothetical protein
MVTGAISLGEILRLAEDGVIGVPSFGAVMQRGERCWLVGWKSGTWDCAESRQLRRGPELASASVRTGLLSSCGGDEALPMDDQSSLILDQLILEGRSLARGGTALGHSVCSAVMKGGQ